MFRIPVTGLSLVSILHKNNACADEFYQEAQVGVVMFQFFIKTMRGTTSSEATNFTIVSILHKNNAPADNMESNTPSPYEFQFFIKTMRSTLSS